MISTLDATLNQAGRPRKRQKATAQGMHAISANSNAVVKNQVLSSLNLASEINAFEELDSVFCKLLPLEIRKYENFAEMENWTVLFTNPMMLQ